MEDDPKVTEIQFRRKNDPDLEEYHISFAWVCVLFGIIAMLVLCLIASLAHAAPIEIIAVNGPYAVDNQQIKQIYDQANIMLSEAKIGGPMKRPIYRIDDQWPTYNNFDLAQSRYYNTLHWLEVQPGHNQHRIRHHIIFPPMTQSGYTGWIAGLTRKICMDRDSSRYSSSNAIAFNLISGESRIGKSAIALAHEIGHMMGAQHDNTDNNIMNKDALSFYHVGDPLPHWNAKALQEMRNCKARQNNGDY